ncbi:MAG: hypothetical protein HY426_03020 [Candidatus Levybacteria bacterium]|nr:hypothetical protein [Candidatus Levybacteria bacterium]
MKKPIILLSILIFVILGLFLVRSAISNRISTSGVELGKTQDVLKKYKTQNIMLREEISTLASLTNISSAAAKNGFVESKSAFAISVARPIALKQ